ncbi:MAG: hypothetical protein HUU06_05360 [Planctomycetaceae bacterium]|nr:hypothetical protein [Planctomycetaceae bacterium]
MSRRKKSPDWLVLDYAVQPPLLTCRRCGATRTLHLPAAVDDVVLQTEAFGKSHLYCKEPPATPASGTGEEVIRAAAEWRMALVAIAGKRDCPCGGSFNPCRECLAVYEAEHPAGGAA